MSETGPSHEQPKAPETEHKVEMTPARAHMLLGASEHNLLNPEARAVTDEQIEQAKQTTPEQVDQLIEVGNEVSWESRHESDKDDTRGLSERVNEWNANFWAASKKFTDESVDAELREERLKGLASVGIDVSADDSSASDHLRQVEAFRQKYVHEDKDKTDLGQFIEDVAKDCMTNGQIDLKKLEKRLDALTPLLIVFGTKRNANYLVSDFAIIKGIVSQPEDTKAAYLEDAKQQLSRDLSLPEHARIHALWEVVEAEADLRTRIQSALDNALTAEQFSDPSTTEEAIDKSKVALKDIHELENAYTILGIKNPTETDDYKLLKLQEEVIRKHGAEPNIDLFLVRNSEGEGFQPHPQIGIAQYPAGVDTPEKMQQLVDAINADLLAASETSLEVTDFLQILQQESIPPTEEYYGPEVAGKSVTNKTQKEDTMLIEGDAIAVFDGVGGGSLGADKAAQASRNFISDQLKHMPQGLSLEETKTWLADLVNRTHLHLFDLKKADPDLQMGQSTVALAFNWNGTHRITVNVGDSNIYSFADGSLEQLTVSPTVRRAALEMLTLQQIARDQGSADGMQFDLAKFAEDNGTTLEDVLKNQRRASLEKAYLEETSDTQDAVSLEEFAQQKGVDLDNGLKTDDSFKNLIQSLIPERVKRMRAQDFDGIGYFTNNELSADGKLDVSQPIESKYTEVIREIARMNDMTRQHMNDTSKALVGSDTLLAATRALHRTLSGIEADFVEYQLPTGRKTGRWENYRDSETGKLVSQKLISFFENRNIISECLGQAYSDTGDPIDIHPEVSVDQLEPGKTVLTLVCSDGLDDNTPQGEIEAKLRAVTTGGSISADDLRRTTEELVDEAKAFADSQFNIHKRAKPDDTTAIIKVSKNEGNSSETTEPERIPDQPLTPELAGRDPETFKLLIVQKLKEKHPLAYNAWQHIVQGGELSLADVTLKPGEFLSWTDGRMIELGTVEMGEKLKERILFDDKSFTYEDEVLYRFAHEFSHKLAHQLINSNADILNIYQATLGQRMEPENGGLSGLGSDHFYRGDPSKQTDIEKAKANQKQANEDVTELINMYLWNPNYLKSYSKFLSDPTMNAERRRSGLVDMDQVASAALYNKIEQALLAHVPTLRSGGTSDSERPAAA